MYRQGRLYSKSNVKAVKYVYVCFLVRVRWLGHVFRIEQKRIPKKVLRRNTSGKKKQGRSKIIPRKTFEG